MAVYATFQLLTAFYRLSGCCPIRGLVREHPSRLECVRISWYTAYSALCVVLGVVTVAEAIADSSTRGSLEARLHVFFAVVIFVLCLVNWTTAVALSPLLISFLRQCASLERRRPPRKSAERGAKRLLLVMAVYGAICSCAQCASRIMAVYRSASLGETVFRVCVLTGAMYLLTWSTLAVATVCLASRIIKTYLEATTEYVISYGSSLNNSAAAGAQFLSEVRLAIRSLKQLFLTADRFLCVPLLVTFASVMANTCTMTFFMVTTEIHLGYTSKFMAVAYVGHSGFTLAMATYYAHKVTEQARKLKESLMARTRASLKGSFQKEVHTLLLCFKAEGFTFNACGFFNVEAPVFRPMVGVVVTYTLVLYQTKLAGRSRSSPHCYPDVNTSLKASSLSSLLV